MIYLEFNFITEPLQPASDILIAELSEIGFESFVENPDGLTAYIEKQKFSEKLFEGLSILGQDQFSIEYTKEQIAQQNWNAQWEKSFEPIVVNNECRVRASFHEKKKEPYDIVIDPKMSFGTGHHETTHMMLQHILEHDFMNKKVLDMGCGTGVLAILTEKKGATKIDAIDIDSWCVENTTENIERNHCKRINTYEGGGELLGNATYDIILANINRNILLDQIPIYSKCMNPKGILFLSGFYDDDLNIISSECAKHGLRFEKKLQKNKWISAKYVF